MGLIGGRLFASVRDLFHASSRTNFSHFSACAEFRHSWLPFFTNLQHADGGTTSWRLLNNKRRQPKSQGGLRTSTIEGAIKRIWAPKRGARRATEAVSASATRSDSQFGGLWSSSKGLPRSPNQKHRLRRGSRRSLLALTCLGTSFPPIVT